MWAFGCDLYELLSGRRAFPGSTRTDTIAAVLSKEPAWELLPGETTAGIRKLKGFAVMRLADWHRFQILTKRAERLAELSPKLPWAPNIWQRVTVEHPDYAYRIDLLRQTGAHVKFLSLEPLLAPMPRLNLRSIDWVIVGGESGPGARPMQEAWVTDLRDQCQKAGVAFYFKQWGGVFKKRNGRTLEGRLWHEMPDVPEPVARLRQLKLVPV